MQSRYVPKLPKNVAFLHASWSADSLDIRSASFNASLLLGVSFCCVFGGGLGGGLGGAGGTTGGVFGGVFLMGSDGGGGVVERSGGSGGAGGVSGISTGGGAVGGGGGFSGKTPTKAVAMSTASIPSRGGMATPEAPWKSLLIEAMSTSRAPSLSSTMPNDVGTRDGVSDPRSRAS